MKISMLSLFFSLFAPILIIVNGQINDPKPYEGYRLAITKLRIVKQSKQFATVKYDLVNTGRLEVRLGQKQKPPESLIVNFDETLDIQNLIDYDEEIISNLRNTKISIKDGEIIPNLEMKLTYNGDHKIIAISKPKKEKQEYLAELDDKIEISKNETASTNQTNSTKTAYQNTNSSKKISTPSKPSTEKSVKKEETVAVVEKTKSKEKKKKKKSGKFKKVMESFLPWNPDRDNDNDGEGFTLNTGGDEDEEEYDPSKCPDIIMENIKVLKRTKKHVTIQYTVRNIGKGPAQMYGKSDDDDDNLAIRTYLSGTPKISRGSMHLLGEFIKDKSLDETDGLLYPEKSVTKEVKIDIRKKTRYNNVLIFELDAFNNIRECDRSNNNQHIIL